MTAPPDWEPKFLCYSIRGPIILSDGRVTTCTMDHEGQNEIGNIHNDDFDTIVSKYARTRLTAMADPVSKPMCFKCYAKLPRWKQMKVPRADWINKGCSSQQKQDFLDLFNPEAISINLELSSNCNLRCIGCSVAKPEFKYSRLSQHIDLESLKKWIGGSGHRISHVRLYHMGETWLHPQWDEICKFLKAQNPAMSLFTSTNGMPMQIGNTIERAVDCGIDHIMFSIHGATAETTQKYMGKGFKIDVALEMARRLAALRDSRRAKLHLSWKYVIFSWNDSEEEIREAKRLCDETGFDELHFSITSSPSPSHRLAKGTAAWRELQDECGSLWKRGEDYLKKAPMSALYPGRRQRNVTERNGAPAIVRPVPESKLPEASQAPATRSTAPKKEWSGSLRAAASLLLRPMTVTKQDIKRGMTSVLDGRPAEGIKRLTRCLSRTGNTSPEVWMRFGEAHLALHHFEEASRCFDIAIGAEGGSEFQFLGKARALRGMGQWLESSEAYESALQHRYRREERLYGEDIYLELATVLEKLGNAEGVRTAYRLWRENSYVKHTANPRSIYCPIPKNACTWLKTAFVQNSTMAAEFAGSSVDAHQFLRNPKNHFRLMNLNFLTHSKYFSFVVLRNPFDRLASAYSNLFIRPLKWHALPDHSVRTAVLEIQRRKGETPDAARSVTFEEFIRHLARTDDYDLDYHFRPQRAFFEQLQDFEFVGRVEDMDAVRRVLTDKLKWSFEGVAGHNRTVYADARDDVRHHKTRPHDLQKSGVFPSTRSLFTDELHDIVMERYAGDFAIYEQAFGQKATLR
ncbi:MAG: sulfotransferase family 2 domain-containing protein [Chthoniobacterales bacterium]